MDITKIILQLYYFWNVVSKLENEQQKKLLKFVTGSSSGPILGFKFLEPLFCIQLAHTESIDDLPTSSTCMNLLKLNPFTSEFVMREKLLYAIENGITFELS